MLFVGALLCVVVCQVSLVRAFMRVCVPCLMTRLDEELSLQQVRNLLPLGRLLLVPSELKALSLVLASTPTVSAGSVLGSERESCSASSALVLACVQIVHYIWRTNGAPQGTSGRHRETTPRLGLRLMAVKNPGLQITTQCLTIHSLDAGS